MQRNSAVPLLTMLKRLALTAVAMALASGANSLQAAGAVVADPCESGMVVESGMRARSSSDSGAGRKDEPGAAFA